jgi:hypothetical protein
MLRHTHATLATNCARRSLECRARGRHGFPDVNFGSFTQLAFLGSVLVVTLVASLAAAVIEHAGLNARRPSFDRLDRNVDAVTVR